MTNLVHDFLCLPARVLAFPRGLRGAQPQLKAFLAELAKQGNPLAEPDDAGLLPSARELL